MPRIVRKLLSALLCVSLTACTSIRTVPDWSVSSKVSAKQYGLNVGDELLITTTPGRPVLMKLTAIEPQALTGRDLDKSDSIRVPFDQITQVERKEFDVLKTTLLVALIVVVGLTAAVKKAAFYPPPP